jgi:hypothetical protein
MKLALALALTIALQSAAASQILLTQGAKQSLGIEEPNTVYVTIHDQKKQPLLSRAGDAIKHPVATVKKAPGATWKGIKKTGRGIKKLNDKSKPDVEVGNTVLTAWALYVMLKNMSKASPTLRLF